MDEAQALLLRRLAAGDRAAADELLPLVYDDLKRRARHLMRDERAGHTLQPTAVVHEAYVQLAQQGKDWEGRAQFLAVASVAMRNLLIDHARRRDRQKRGGDLERVTLGDRPAEADLEVPALDLRDALEDLERRDERQARIVELRYFGGLTIQEVAEVLEVSHATVERDWVIARAWLRGRLEV